MLLHLSCPGTFYSTSLWEFFRLTKSRERLLLKGAPRKGAPLREALPAVKVLLEEKALPEAKALLVLANCSSESCVIPEDLRRDGQVLLATHGQRADDALEPWESRVIALG